MSKKFVLAVAASILTGQAMAQLLGIGAGAGVGANVSAGATLGGALRGTAQVIGNTGAAVDGAASSAMAGARVETGARGEAQAEAEVRQVPQVRQRTEVRGSVAVPRLELGVGADAQATGDVNVR